MCTRSDLCSSNHSWADRRTWSRATPVFLRLRVWWRNLPHRAHRHRCVRWRMALAPISMASFRRHSRKTPRGVTSLSPSLQQTSNEHSLANQCRRAFQRSATNSRVSSREIAPSRWLLQHRSYSSRRAQRLRSFPRARRTISAISRRFEQRSTRLKRPTFPPRAKRWRRSARAHVDSNGALCSRAQRVGSSTSTSDRETSTRCSTHEMAKFSSVRRVMNLS